MVESELTVLASLCLDRRIPDFYESAFSFWRHRFARICPIERRYRWTREMVATLINRKFNITLAANSVGRLLAQLGITCQKPLHRAIERDESLVRQWLEKEYPQIKAMAKKQGADIYFGDAAHIRSDHPAGRTWGAKATRPSFKRPALAMA